MIVSDLFLSVWSWVSLAGIAVGLFLVISIAIRPKSNRQASWLFAVLLGILIAVNFDHWLYASGVWLNFPLLAGFSRGSFLLIGPLIYFYSRSIIAPDFRLSPRYVVHAIPYLVLYALMIPYLYLFGPDYKLIAIRYGYIGRDNMEFSYTIIMIA